MPLDPANNKSLASHCIIGYTELINIDYRAMSDCHYWGSYCGTGPEVDIITLKVATVTLQMCTELELGHTTLRTRYRHCAGVGRRHCYYTTVVLG